MIDCGGWAALRAVGQGAKQRLEEADGNHYNSETVILCELALAIADIMTVVSTFPETQGKERGSGI